MEAERDMYQTRNSAYGEAWQTGGCFPKSFTQYTSRPFSSYGRLQFILILLQSFVFASQNATETDEIEVLNQ